MPLLFNYKVKDLAQDRLKITPTVGVRPIFDRIGYFICRRRCLGFKAEFSMGFSSGDRRPSLSTTIKHHCKLMC